MYCRLEKLPKSILIIKNSFKEYFTARCALCELLISVITHCVILFKMIVLNLKKNKNKQISA